MKNFNFKTHKKLKLSTCKTKIIYVIRHGEPLGYLKRYLGQRNPPLSKLGIEQAQYWRDYFSCVRIDKIYASNLTRALQTAEIISEGHATMTVECVPEIKEINLGRWDGMDFKMIRKKYPISFRSRGADLEHYRPPQGESFSDLKARIIPAFNRIIRSTSYRSIVVSHAGVNRVIIANILKSPLNEIFKIRQDYGAINKIVINQGKKKIVYTNHSFPLFGRDKNKPKYPAKLI